MRPALEEAKTLEAYINNTLAEEKIIEMEIQLLWDQPFKNRLALQRVAYQALRAAGQQQLRRELKAIHTRLFNWTIYLIYYSSSTRLNLLFQANYKRLLK